MRSEISAISRPALVGVGLIVGIAISAVDNFAFGGEVSPIVIVALLLVASSAAASVWGWRAWLLILVLWICLPLAHLVKHLLGIPDTLHPNTYASILKLAAFTFVITAIGTGCGVMLNRMREVNTSDDSDERST